MEHLAVNRVEAVAMLCVSVRTLDAMIARGEIRGRRIGRRIVFTVEELRRFLAKDHPVPRQHHRPGADRASPAPAVNNSKRTR